MQMGRVRSCVRPVDTARMAVGPGAIYGSRPSQKHALDAPRPKRVFPILGSTDLHYVTFTPPNS